MTIASVQLLSCAIPFHFSYGHALALHRGVTPVLCIIRDTEGNYGVGESVPREYVTGESVASVLNDAETILRRIVTGTITTAEALERFSIETDRFGNPFPSCAVNCIDGALMSLKALQEKRPLYTLLGTSVKKQLQYYGSIGIGSTLALLPKLLFYRLTGFKHFKVKVAGTIDISRIEKIKKVLGKGVTLFADANCAWSFREAVDNACRLYKAGVWALEEPLVVGKGAVCGSGQVNREKLLTAAHYQQYHKLKQEIPIPLIADESCISPESMQKIVEYDAFSIANIRLSKCGGTQVSNKLYKQAVTAGMSVGLGAMVGESPFLATIGSHFGVAHPDHRYIQGHSHRVLHRVQIGRGEPSMNHGAKMQLTDTPGIGVMLCQKTLEKVTTSRKEFLL